jgi:glucose 1-dehydrogenase
MKLDTYGGCRVSQRVALVTGANRGIGRGCALALARDGADVVINYRSHAGEAEEVAAEVRALGRQAVTVQGDVGKREHCAAIVHAAVEAFGRLDILVANAAWSVRKPFLELQPDEWQGVLDVTLGGVFHTAQAACRQMVSQGDGGSVIAISSVHAVLAFKNSVAYNTAKAGLNHMVKTIANELAQHGIRANVVEPGWIETPGELRFVTKEQINEASKQLPLGRIGTIDDIGAAVAYLASPQASYVTGSVLRVDGGFVLPRPSL